MENADATKESQWVPKHYYVLEETPRDTAQKKNNILFGITKKSNGCKAWHCHLNQKRIFKFK